jgi:hypothetical protein
VAPAAPRRRPRRPLTDEDFPELAGHDDDAGAGDGGERRKGGLFSWVAGRTRGRSAQGGHSEARNSDASAPREEPRIGKTESAYQSGTERHQSRPESGQKEAKPRINRGNGNGSTGGEEPFDIPDFFKRPLN